MNKTPLFESVDPALEAGADRRAEADVQAGRLVSHGAVRRWLTDWSKGIVSPRPRTGE